MTPADTTPLRACGALYRREKRHHHGDRPRPRPRHPALTERWHDRHRRLTAAHPGLQEILTDVITHPEMLAIACLLLGSQHVPVRPGQITASSASATPAALTPATRSSSTWPASSCYAVR